MALLKHIGIYAAIVTAIGLVSILLLRPTALDLATNNTNNRGVGALEDATLTGTLQLTICGGAQPNYPNPSPCEQSVARNTIIYITHDGQIVAETKTDATGHYSFTVKPGAYTLKVQGESTSEGHDVKLQAGPNNLDFSATLHTP